MSAIMIVVNWEMWIQVNIVKVLFIRNLLMEVLMLL